MLASPHHFFLPGAGDFVPECKPVGPDVDVLIERKPCGRFEVALVSRSGRRTLDPGEHPDIRVEGPRERLAHRDGAWTLPAGRTYRVTRRGACVMELVCS